MAKIIIILVFSLSIKAQASTFFMPDSDTAALIALVSNTASTVTNTLKILEVAQKTSQQVDRYNFIAMRRFFIARRIEQHVRDMAATQKMSTQGLAQLNQKLLRLKMNLQGLKSNIDFAAKDVFAAQDFVDRSWDKLVSSMEDEQEAYQQELSSASEGTVSKHVQNTAINTALSAKILAKMHRDDLDYQRTDLALKKNEQLEQLRREDYYKSWLGINESTDPLTSLEAEKL